MKMKFSLALSAVCLLQAALCADPIVIKFGSLAPVGSPWDVNLKKISAEWSRISEGQVQLKIYSGGIVGDETDMIRKIKIGQLNAVGLTGMGLSRIYNGIMSLQMPLLVRTDDELDYVLKKMQPYFEENLKARGFKVLFWTRVGWAHFFGKKPIIGPEDLKKQKFFVWEGNADDIQVWKDEGFNAVPIPATEIMTALQSGMVESFTTSPLSAAAYQWFGLAPNMCGMKWAPFIGALLFSDKTWERIPVDLQKKLTDAANKIGASMQTEIFQADEKAIGIMKQNGLTVSSVPENVVDQWQTVVTRGFMKMEGKSFEKNAYEKIRTLLAEYRKNRR